MATFRSSASQHSRSVCHFITDIEEFSDEELIKLVNDVKREIRLLNLESEVFEKTLMRLDPSLMDGVQRAIDYATKLQLQNTASSLQLTTSSTTKAKFSGVESLGSSSRILTSPGRMLASNSRMLTSPSRMSTAPSRMLASPSRISTRKVDSSARTGGTILGLGPRVNVLERSELVSIEMEIIVTNLEKARKKAAKQRALLKAQEEEITIRVADIEKATETFNQQVIIDGYDRIAQRIPAEIWIRYMNEWVKICDMKIGKLRLRTSTLNTSFSKLTGQIKVKTELHENLRPVDFEKLEIENGECLVAIDRKIHQLAELKKMTGEANLNLTMHKKAITRQNQYLNSALEGIKKKEKETVLIDKERDVIEEKTKSLEVRLDAVRKLRQMYEVPEVMDYVRIKAELTELRVVCKALETRAHVQQIALKSMNKKIAASMFFSKVLKF